jgi:hypothetical protein
MLFAFTKKLTGDILQLLAKAKVEAEKAGGKISGDEHSGDFSGKTPFGSISGTYTAVDGILNVTISKKPMLVPESAIKDAFNGYFV